MTLPEKCLGIRKENIGDKGPEGVPHTGRESRLGPGYQYENPSDSSLNH